MKRMVAILLAVLMVAKVGCNTTPTPASPLSSAQEKKFEEELKKKRAEEGKGQREK